jgi:hypothetical protein
MYRQSHRQRVLPRSRELKKEGQTVGTTEEAKPFALLPSSVTMTSTSSNQKGNMTISISFEGVMSITSVKVGRTFRMSQILLRPHKEVGDSMSRSLDLVRLAVDN